ncbi:DUF982 domain-containing protein [Mesorhizobium sp. M7A.F.Ca.US.014.04.1.1]|uniref:DUF982 domain-containing protein n=1 Tax=Mesorhizobium australicum (strain HAMBI 3006 / LMG 24608 / WSM2073) TaxID=754035 RepID=L0KH39_MESAW|nr:MULTISPECIES: DUF982 domain-containing protein [Mesorhizobium]AGB43383.1 Protein of unknown function (DUF982) [Mesorhizobium australicum WSM2073]AMX97890.1 hypothetical protein A4R28_32385 [Mesorhizobium ciceri]MDF3233834.1 DUF982 domain-containing protein [Mesorhizobium sp. DSM 30133]RUU16351.1 DUF982 domain-containing protein [Mesorhizobium sp. Primo-B]RUU34530.1 DUF982 domain-containing protein [Mesorhizobium sp. Primo-A]
MQDKRFDMPVSVALGRSGNTIYKVERVAQAADVLLNRWPAVTGKSHVAARRACLAVLDGIKEASVARAAFVKAAADADILREDDYGRG